MVLCTHKKLSGQTGAVKTDHESVTVYNKFQSRKLLFVLLPSTKHLNYEPITTDGKSKVRLLRTKHKAIPSEAKPSGQQNAVDPP